jgi:hypothetical protein
LVAWIAVARNAIPERPSISHAGAVIPSTRTHLALRHGRITRHRDLDDLGLAVAERDELHPPDDLADLDHAEYGRRDDVAKQLREQPLQPDHQREQRQLANRGRGESSSSRRSWRRRPGTADRNGKLSFSVSQSVGRNDPCPCGSGRKYKRCCLDADRQAGPRPAARGPAEPRRGELTLIVETARGVMARTIPSASPLRTDRSHGSAAEAATHDAAAIWGMPDFVFLPETLAVGSGRRELGDGIIIVDDIGVVVQVKSRETPSAEPDKERSWLLKKASEALSQGAGTIRRLKQGPQGLTNLRGTRIEIDTPKCDWFTVAVLDHPDPPDDVTPSVQDARHPAVVLLRRDWEFLFDQLKSTHAVVQYFRRVAGDDCELGHEPVRYYDLAQADADATPETFPAGLAQGGEIFSGPLLPMAPAADDDRQAHEIVRTMFEDIAVTHLTSASELDRLRILAELDRLPVIQRAEIGRFVLRAMQEVTEHGLGNGVFWRLRSVRGNAAVHLGFGACSRPYSDEIAHGFRLWLQLRHHDVLAITKDVERLTSVAVVLTPRTDGRRPWDTSVAAVSGPEEFEPEVLAKLRELFPGPERSGTE